jgi:hypothetical protein
MVITGGMPWAILLAVLKHGHAAVVSAAPMLVIALQVVPVPLTLLAIGTFYLWVFVSDAAGRMKNPAPNMDIDTPNPKPAQ